MSRDVEKYRYSSINEQVGYLLVNNHRRRPWPSPRSVLARTSQVIVTLLSTKHLAPFKIVLDTLDPLYIDSAMDAIWLLLR